jgi:HAD superfamily hydrolase (TIGR01549 family)
MKKIEAVFFDIDGTLVDSRVRMFKRITEILPEERLPHPDSIADYYHLSETDALRALAQPETEEDFQKILETASRVDRYPDLLRHSPNLISVMKTLSISYKLGSITNANHIVIDEIRSAHDENGQPLNMDEYIGVWLSADDGYSPKPAPDMFLAMADALEVEPEESVYVGDTSRTDVEGALNANMRSIQIKRRGEDRDPRADKYISRIEELPLAISGLSMASKGMSANRY